MPLTIRHIPIKPLPRKLRPHHPPPMRPHRPIRGKQPRQQHRLRSQRPKLRPLVIVKFRSKHTLDIRRLDGVNTLLRAGDRRNDGVGVAVLAIFAGEVRFEEVAAERGAVDFVFAVERVGEGEGVGGVADGEAFLESGEVGELVVGVEGLEEVG